MTSEQARAWWRWAPWTGRATRADKGILGAALAVVVFQTARYMRRRHYRRAGGEDGDLSALSRADEPCPSR